MTADYTTHQTFIRDDFILKEGWEYILTQLATKHTDPNGRDEVIQEIKKTLKCDRHINPFLSAGGGRNVFILPQTAHTSYHPHVVKFAKNTEDRNLKGTAQNAVESGIWDRYESRTLVPVSAVHDKYTWLIMPFGTPQDETNVSDKEIDTLLDSVYDEIGREIDPSELKPQNIVMIDNDLYMCDYGYRNALY